MQVLVLLAAHAGQVVAKERLMQTVWPDAFVTDDVLTRAISELRRVFGDDAKDSHFIQTIPKTGYRLIGPVSTRAEGTEAAPAHVAGTGDRTAARSWKRALGASTLAAAMLGGVLLWRWQATGMPVSPVMIAVLPFEHLGGDPEREYLTDGLTEEVSASLGQIEHLSVKGRTSTRMYKGTGKSLADIGRELGVEYLVEGSVQAESARLRVTAKLIRVRDQVQVWAEAFDSEPGSMLELQRELSAGIARQVGLRLSPNRLTALAPRYTQNAEAYDSYLRGRHSWNQLTPETNRSAAASYVRATQLDSGFALAWSGLADIYSASPITGDVPPLEIADRARAAITHAVAAGPDLPETLTAQGTVHYWLDWDWRAAESAFRKAIAVDASYSQAHRQLGLVLTAMGRHDEARDAMSHARKLEPFYPMQTAVSAYERLMARDYPSALEFARRATGVDPKFWIGNFMLAAVYERLGNSDLALEGLAKAEAASGNSKMLSLRGYILAKSGRTKQAEEALRTLKSIARERYVPPYTIALVHAGLGQHDAAFAWLEKAYDVRDVHLIFLAAQDPKWDDLREDPRFRELVERCDFMRTAKPGARLTVPR